MIRGRGKIRGKRGSKDGEYRGVYGMGLYRRVIR
jgi:hypothetical protein